MSKKTITNLLLCLVTMLAMGVVVGCGSLDEKDGGTTTAPKATKTKVTISGYKFRPQILTVSEGTKVTWTNKDQDTHTVTAKNGAFDSTLKSGKSWSYTFNKAGTYHYHDRINDNPGLRGKIIVE